MNEDKDTRVSGPRLGDLGARDPAETIRRGELTRAATKIGPSEPPTTRELPMISVDLRSVKAASGRGIAVEPTARDLEILAVLGEGGMGRVFLARQHSLDREVAIKTLREDAHVGHRRALLEEGAVTGFLEHPAIIPVHALGVDATDRPALVMKRVEGVSWLELIRDPDHPEWRSRGGDRALRLDDHLEIFQQVCNAAHFAHTRGVVHRDIKPQNVLIGRFGDVYLADWGIAYRMSAGEEPELCGTPAYMAPEMAIGGAIDARTDVYLLGATLHEILTGQAKHPGNVVRDVVDAAVRSELFAYGPGVPHALAVIANRATMYDPRDRFASAAALRQAVSDFVRHKSSVALAESALERLERLKELASRTASHTREDAQREIDQLIAEARFGLTQAVEQWDGNASARQGLEELEALLAVRRARSAELERLAEDLDPTVAARQRMIGQVSVTLVGIGLSIMAFARGIDYQPTPDDLIQQSLGPLAVAASSAVVMRKHLFRTALNRRALLCLGVAVTSITVGRLIGARAGDTSAQMLAHDCLGIAAVSVVTAASTFRWLVWCGVVMSFAAVACGLWPGRAAFSFALGTATALLMIVVFSARVGNRPA